MRAVTLTMAFATLAIGCEPAARGPAAVTVRDSVGVTIVESVAPIWADGEGWTIPGEPEIVIGEAEGDERYLLDDVHGARRFPDGRIALLDRGSSRVRVYNAGGRHLFDVGGPGDGPAEFSTAQYMDLVGDTIVVYEYAPATLTWFDDSGDFLRTVPLPNSPSATPLFGKAFSFLGGDGVMVAVVSQPDLRPGRRREAMSLWRLDLIGPEVDSLTAIRTEEIFVYNTGGWNDVLFGKTTYFTASDRWIYVAPSDAYSIRVLDSQGVLRRIIRLHVEPRAVTPADGRRWAEQYVAVTFSPPDRVDEIVTMTEELAIAETMPAFRHLTVDADENLWVEDWDDVGIEQGAFSVFRSDGAWLGKVDLPMGLPHRRGFNSRTSVLEIGMDYVLGVWTGDLGVEQVRLYRLEKSTVDR